MRTLPSIDFSRSSSGDTFATRTLAEQALSAGNTFIENIINNIVSIVNNFITEIVENNVDIDITQLTQITNFLTFLQQLITVTNITELVTVVNQFITVNTPSPTRRGCTTTISYVSDVVCLSGALTVTKKTLTFVDGLLTCADTCGGCLSLPRIWGFTSTGIEPPACEGCLVANNYFEVEYVSDCVWEGSAFSMCGSEDAKWQLLYNSLLEQWELRLLDLGGEAAESSCCVPLACWACGAGALPETYTLTASGASGACCTQLNGTWTLNHVGGCVWRTPQQLDFTACGGSKGPAWELTSATIGGTPQWLLTAAGSPVGSKGNPDPNDPCGGPITFHTTGWPLGGGAGCDWSPGSPIVLTPGCECPGGTNTVPASGDLLWTLPRASFNCCGSNILTPEGLSSKCFASSPIEIAPVGNCETRGGPGESETSQEGCCACADETPPIAVFCDSNLPGCPSFSPSFWVSFYYTPGTGVMPPASPYGGQPLACSNFNAVYQDLLVCDPVNGWWQTNLGAPHSATFTLYFIGPAPEDARLDVTWGDACMADQLAIEPIAGTTECNRFKAQFDVTIPFLTCGCEPNPDSGDTTIRLWFTDDFIP